MQHYFWAVSAAAKPQTRDSESHIDRPPEKALHTQVRSIYPPGPHSSFNDVASVTAKIVASIHLTEMCAGAKDATEASLGSYQDTRQN